MNNPITPDGHKWAQWLHETNWINRTLATLVCTDETGTVAILGNTFVVYSNDRFAICICASHSLEEEKRKQMSRSAKGYLNVSNDFKPILELMKCERLFALFEIDGEHISCRVVDLDYSSSMDVAIIMIEVPDRFVRGTAIDLGAPMVGDEVAVLAYKVSSTGKSDETVHSQHFEVRSGFVTGHNLSDPPRRGLYMTFDTTIPLAGGMSGAPVVTVPEDDADLVVCGMVSTDFSTHEAKSSFDIKGTSTISLLWPSMGLGFKSIQRKETFKSARFRSLSEMEVLDDRSSKLVEAWVTHGPDTTKVNYCDDRKEFNIRADYTLHKDPNR